MLLGQVASLFERQTTAAAPRYAPGASVPIPASSGMDLPGAMGKATNRRVFRSVLHQSSKYREFLTGILPDLRNDATAGKFRITQGTLYRASEFAKETGHAALVVIDEINRGPAVQVFGGAIVAIEADKRLDDSGEPTHSTHFFDLLDPEDGELIEYAFPPRLYLLAAMNQADVSVEPMDVAFLRRWSPIALEPSSQVLRGHFGVEDMQDADLPETPTKSEEVLEATVRAFEALNRRIALGRGPEFRIGHGMLMALHPRPPDLDGVLRHLATVWTLMKNHIDEVFFGDIRGSAIVLNADKGIAGNPYVLAETVFGDAPRAELKGPDTIPPEHIYPLMTALASVEA